MPPINLPSNPYMPASSESGLDGDANSNKDAASGSHNKINARANPRSNQRTSVTANARLKTRSNSRTSAGSPLRSTVWNAEQAEAHQSAQIDIPRGNFKGLSIAVAPDIFSVIEDAEEMAVELADDLEVEMSEEDDEEDVRFDARHEDVPDDQIDGYFAATKRATQVRRKEFVAEILRGRLAALHERLEQENPRDPTAQFLTLQQALHEGERRLSAATLATGQGTTRNEQGIYGAVQAVPTNGVLGRIRDAMEEIASRHGTHVRADLNTIDIARTASDSAEGVRLFQSTYRDIVLGSGTLSGTLNYVLENFDDDDTGPALTRLTQALGQDLASLRPSTDGVRLQALLQDQYMAEAAMAVLERCRKLVGPEPVARLDALSEMQRESGLVAGLQAKAVSAGGVAR